jgi:hypothetical protein
MVSGFPPEAENLKPKHHLISVNIKNPCGMN